MNAKELLPYLASNLLKRSDITFNKEELFFQIMSHPSFPSLHSITGVLNHFNIENIAARVPVNAETVEQLPPSFLAQFKVNGQEELTLVRKLGRHYELTTPHKKEKFDLAQFLKRFTGIIVAVERGEDVGVEVSSNNKFISTILLGSLGIVLLLPLLFIEAAPVYFVFLLLSLLGGFLSISIVKQELGETSLIGNALCSTETKTTSCNEVLFSKGASIVGHFKLSDLSVVYFLSLSLLSYLLILLNLNLTVVIAISFMAFPVTLYSIYYQKFVLKKWCLLCIGIVAVLWAQVILAVFNFNLISLPSQAGAFVSFTAFLVVLSIWSFLSSFLKKGKEHREMKIDYLKFKRSFKLFNAILEKGNAIKTEIPDISEIMAGNVNSPLNITVITNPLCGYCKTVHSEIEKILKEHGERVNICIRFNVNTDDQKSEAVKITSRLIDLYNSNSRLECMQAMHDIYGDETPAKWINKWGAPQNKERAVAILRKEKKWCVENDFNFTPVVLINGRPIPKEYQSDDLIYFIEELYEEAKKLRQ